MLLSETYKAAVTIFLILHKHSLQIQLLVERLHLGYLLSLFLPRVLLRNLALFRRGPLQTLNPQPAAFVAPDVSANLAHHNGVPKQVTVTILNLKELPHLQQNHLVIGTSLLPSMLAIYVAATTGR